MTARFWILVLVSVGFSYSARGADGWNQWGGPNRDFVAATSRALPAWSGDGPRVLWRRDLGPGYSGIVPDGKRLYTMVREGDREVVVALDPEVPLP